MLIKTLALFFVLATLSGINLKAATPPNVIVVNLDDIGPAWFPPYARQIKPDQVEDRICREYAEKHKGEGKFDLAEHLDAARHSMPFLDHLADQGVAFDRCFATSSLCSPSRAGLLSGCYQQRWGGYSLDDMTLVGIPRSVPILAEYFQKAGYLCGVVGKWHVALRDPALLEAAQKQLEAAEKNPTKQEIEAAADLLGYGSSCAPGDGPLDRGFDYYFGYNLDHSQYYEADNLWDGRERVPKRPPGEFLTDLFNAKCVGFVTKAVDQNKPFLLYYAPMSLHGLIQPPPEKYSVQFHTGIPFTNQWAGHLLAIDEGIRQIYDVLKAHGQDQNTLLVLTADNGQSWYRVPPYDAPYRGGKGTGWLGGAHEPFIFSWPGHVQPGIRHELVSTMDIFATALDAAGLKPAQLIDGKSLLPLMQGATDVSPHAELFCSGLHSTNWSDSYFDESVFEKIKPDLVKKHDDTVCPLFGWAQDDHSVYLAIGPTAAGLYPQFPQGRPAQKMYFDLTSDPQQRNSLTTNPEAEQNAARKLDGWLQQVKPPATEHMAGYQDLLKMNAP